MFVPKKNHLILCVNIMPNLIHDTNQPRITYYVTAEILMYIFKCPTSRKIHRSDQVGLHGNAC